MINEVSDGLIIVCPEKLALRLSPAGYVAPSMLQAATLSLIQVAQSYQCAANTRIGMCHLKNGVRPELCVEATGEHRTNAMVVKLQIVDLAVDFSKRRQRLTGGQQPRVTMRTADDLCLGADLMLYVAIASATCTGTSVWVNNGV